MLGRACRNRRPSPPSVPPQSIDHPEVFRRWGLRRPRGQRTGGAAAGPKKGGERTRRLTTMSVVAFRFFVLLLLVYFSETFSASCFRRFCFSFYRYLTTQWRQSVPGPPSVNRQSSRPATLFEYTTTSIPLAPRPLRRGCPVVGKGREKQKFNVGNASNVGRRLLPVLPF